MSAQGDRPGLALSLNKPRLDNLAGDIWKSAERLRGKFKAAEVLGKRPKLSEMEIAKPVIRWADSPQLGYEILPNKYFYRYQPPAPADELLAEFWRLEKEAEALLKGLAQ